MTFSLRALTILIAVFLGTIAHAQRAPEQPASEPQAERFSSSWLRQHEPSLFVGYASTTLTIIYGNDTTTQTSPTLIIGGSLSGSLSPDFKWEGGLLYQSFSASFTRGSGLCGSEDCHVEYQGVSVFGRVGYVLIDPRGFAPQLRVGADSLIAYQTSHNFDTDLHMPVTFLTVGFAFRVPLIAHLFLPIAVDYGAWAQLGDNHGDRIMATTGLTF